MSKPVARQFTSREEWLEARFNTLGGSDIPAALFNEGNRSALVVQYEKLRETPPWEPTPRYRMGNAAEGILSEIAEEKLGFPVLDPSKSGPVIYYNSDCPKLHVTPDRFVVNERPLRIHPGTLPEKAKAVLSLKTWTMTRRDMWGDVPPLYALIQLQAEMLITGVHVGAIAVGFGLCEDFSMYDQIEFNPRLGERIRTEAPVWWERHIVRREAVKARASDHEILKQIYPTATPGSFIVLAGESWEKKYAQLQFAKQTEKHWADVAGNLESEFKQKMETAEVAVISPTEALSWKTQVRNDPPKPARSYTVRVFRAVKPPKEVLNAITTGDLAVGQLEVGGPVHALPGAVGSDREGDIAPPDAEEVPRNAEG